MHEPTRSEQPQLHRIDWNDQAAFYNAFAFCELDDTARYLDAIGICEDDSVLDVCCGPGRVSVVAAERARCVTGIDSAEKMLDAARANAAERGLDNVEFRLQDWNHVLPGQNVQAHDVVIASRCGAMMDVEKLSSLAKRTVAVQIFADAPSLPELLNVLFSGCGGDEPGPGGHGPAGRPGGPGAGPGPMGGAAPSGRRPSIYLKIAEKAYNAGFDPNVRIFPERFRKSFATRDEAVTWICSLKPDKAAGNEERVALNAEPFLSETDDGIEFCIATAAAIIWWDVRGKAAWLAR